MGYCKKKSKFRSILINKKRYYFCKITWLDILGDSGHADSNEFNEMKQYECTVFNKYNAQYKSGFRIRHILNGGSGDGFIKILRRILNSLERIVCWNFFLFVFFQISF